MHEDEPDRGHRPDRSAAAKPKAGRGREQSPTQRALGLLVRREHSRKELARKLTSRGLESAEVKVAIDRLSAEGWQDDARFAESLVRSRAASGYGPVRIRAELATHGLDRDAVARALESHHVDWVDNARELVERRFGVALTDPARRRKAADFLLRRGFDMASIRRATGFDTDD